MRKSKLLFSIGAAMVAISLFVFAIGCHKKTIDTTEDSGFATDHATSEQTFNDVQTIADQASAAPAGSLGYRTTATTGSGCATVTKSGDSVIIDFGATDCLCHDGRLRRGKIIATFTGGSYTTTGSVHTITFDNYYQNDNKVTGTKTVTNMGLNSLGQPYFSVVINGAVTLASGGTISSSWTRTRTWVAGSSTTDQSDDVYNITGTGSLTRANGTVVSIEIAAATPLVVANNCHWIEAGTVTYTFAGKTRSMNYGTTAACDDMATVTLANGTIKNITLP